MTAAIDFTAAPILADRPGVRVCTRCVMDATDRDITFDADGVCHHCHDYDREVALRVRSGAEGRRQLLARAEQIRRDGAGRRYDCVIGVSGGVDSTYVAYQVKQLGLRPLAVHLDNGWDSEIAATNIGTALRALTIDLETLVIDWEEFKDIQLAFLRSGVPDCEIPSDHAIVASVHRVASQHRVRHSVWGYNTRTETHLPKAWSQGHYDWGYIRAVHRQFGSGRIRTYPHLPFKASLPLGAFRSTHLNLLDYVDYVKAEAVTLLERELGWRRYGGKHHENIYTRWYQGWFLPTRFGYDKRKVHLSSLVCSGEITREHALGELRQPPYAEDLQRADTEYVIKKLGLTTEGFHVIMTGPKRTFDDFPSHARLRQGRPYRTAQQVYRFAKYRVLGFGRKAGS
jgi:N-acetyl sugar amidotransferase